MKRQARPLFAFAARFAAAAAAAAAVRKIKRLPRNCSREIQSCRAEAKFLSVLRRAGPWAGISSMLAFCGELKYGLIQRILRSGSDLAVPRRNRDARVFFRAPYSPEYRNYSKLLPASANRLMSGSGKLTYIRARIKYGPSYTARLRSSFRFRERSRVTTRLASTGQRGGR